MVLWGGLGLYYLPPALKKFDESVLSVTSPAHLTRVQKSVVRVRGLRRYYHTSELHVGSQTFGITDDEAALFTEGAMYKVYYRGADAGDILSVETA